MPYVLKLAADVGGMITFYIPSNVKLQKSATIKLENNLYDCVPHDLFNFFESLNNRASKFQRSDKVGITMILKRRFGHERGLY